MRKASPRHKNENQSIEIEQLLEPTSTKDLTKTTCATSGADDEKQLSGEE